MADANEAETRRKVIDEVLHSVLGWTVDDIQFEERTSEDGTTTFADYRISVSTTAFVVEAKRVGACFLLPSKRTSLKLGGVLGNGEVGEAIRQARDYCRRLNSVPFAVVTNGNSWIIFPAVRQDRVSFEDSQARVFASLREVKERFVEFWELLSRQRVMEGNLETELLGKTGGEHEVRKLLSIVRDSGYRLGRNSVYEYIEPAVDAALMDESLLSDAAALAACYVKSSERIKYDSRLQVYLKDAKPLDHPATRVRSRKNEGAFDAKLKGAPAAQPRFIMLLGPVGAGKTTFLHYTRLVSAAEAMKSVLWLYLDFKKATDSDEPRGYIYSQLLQLIENDKEFGLGDWDKSIRPAYREYIENLKRGALFLLAKASPAEFDTAIARDLLDQRAKVEPYVETILRHAVGSRPGFLVIDNVDQIVNEGAQQKIFVEAQAIARRIGLNVIMSMRDATYLRHRASPVFDAFQFDSFYVEPPQVRPVLSRRFALAKDVLKGIPADVKTDNGKTVKVKDLSVFFDIVSRSLLNDDTGYMVEVMSGGDIRQGLAYVREFLSSGHTTADRALTVYLADGEYNFPRHEVLRGSVLGQRKYYREDESLLLNVFDARLGPGAHTLRLHLIGLFVGAASEAGFEGIQVEQLLEEAARLGICEADVQKTLGTLVLRRVLRTEDGAEMSASSRLLPTRLAAYLLKEMAATFAYVEFVLLDTAIHDSAVWERLVALTQEIEGTHEVVARTEKRLERIREFMKYLAVKEDAWIVECKRRGIPQGWGRAWIRETIVPGLEKDLDRVLRSANIRYGKRT
jgi:predicted type IV restriction endonuclease